MTTFAGINVTPSGSTPVDFAVTSAARNRQVLVVGSPDDNTVVTPRTNGAVPAIPVVVYDGSGNAITSFGGAASTASSVHTEATTSVSTTSTALLASYASRVKAWVKSVNANTVDCYVSLSATATTAKPTLLSPGDVYQIQNYTGAVSAITASGSVSLEVVEL